MKTKPISIDDLIKQLTTIRNKHGKDIAVGFTNDFGDTLLITHAGLYQGFDPDDGVDEQAERAVEVLNEHSLQHKVVAYVIGELV